MWEQISFRGFINVFNRRALNGFSQAGKTVFDLNFDIRKKNFSLGS